MSALFKPTTTWIPKRNYAIGPVDDWTDSVKLENARDVFLKMRFREFGGSNIQVLIVNFSNTGKLRMVKPDNNRLSTFLP